MFYIKHKIDNFHYKNQTLDLLARLVNLQEILLNIILKSNIESLTLIYRTKVLFFSSSALSSLIFSFLFLTSKNTLTNLFLSPYKISVTYLTWFNYSNNIY
jgi:hypothetical protein